MHPLLAEQLQRAGFDVGSMPGGALERLLELVERAYEDSDAERRQLQQSLDEASGELVQVRRSLSGATRGARESEQRYRALIDNSANGVVTINAAGVIRMANGAAGRMLRRGADELVGRPIGGLLIEADGTRVDARLGGLISGDERVVGRELRIRLDDEAVRVLSVSTTRIDDPGTSEPLLLVEFLDVTDALDAERQRRLLHEYEQEHQRLQALAHSVSAGLLVTDPDGRVQFVNHLFCELFGFDGCPTHPSIGEAAEILDATLMPGDRIAMLLGGKDFDGRPREVEVRSGRTGRYVKVTHFQILGMDGASLGEGLMAMDVTAIRLAEDRMAEFVSLAAHELMTPLTGIIGYAHLVAEAASGTEQGGWAAHIAEEAERLDATVSELLTVARMAGDLDFILEPVDLAEVLGSAASAVGAASNAAVELDVEPALVVYADPTRLREVVDNLVSNALKYSPPGGGIEIAAARTDGGVALTVTDRGLGIPPEDLPRIFERFFRARNSAHAGVRGTGLGLYIVKGFVERMGGRVSVQSAPGVGSTFTVWLPSAATLEAAA